jgi:hypothetical protein
MAFGYTAAIRDADRIHAIRLAKARKLGLTLKEYHERYEVNKMSKTQIENFNHLPFAERATILRGRPTTMTSLDKVAERLSLVRESLAKLAQTEPQAKIAYDHATEGLIELREHAERTV